MAMNIIDLGLSSKQLKENIEKYGLNRLPKKKNKTLFQIYLAQYKNPIIYILLFAAMTAFFIEEYSDVFFILGVLFLNSLIGTFQEYRAEIKAQKLEDSFKTEAVVIRDGQTLKIPSEDLTVDDLVLLESGTKVPADLALKQTQSLYIDESLLTGESLEVEKNADNPESNEAFAGTIVTKGRAYGKVSAVGLKSQIGTIATLLAQASKGKAPLEIRIKKLSITIVKTMIVVISLMFLIGFLREMSIEQLLFLAIALTVSAIPEGLPIGITIALSSASYAMSKKGVIIKKLSAIEAMGSCTLIASDKTGTLTKNELSVERFIAYDKLSDKNLVKIGAILCNDIQYKKDARSLKFIGDQVDIALTKHVITSDEEYLQTLESYKKIDEIPYESQNRYSAIMVQKDDTQFEFIKGSPETILKFCNIEEKKKKEILKEINQYASNGFRNIAIAFKKEKINEDSKDNITLEDFEYLGFMAIIDPIRDESFDAIKTAKEAGIDVIMITGDHPNTAFYISKELNICENIDQVMDYKDIVNWKNNGANPEEIRDVKVFARIKPEQKKDIVCAFQELGHYVAVTGDGVNDSPALKHANIGIAMGKGGTDIAKSTGDIILTDDNFQSIINGIEEGRRAYDNIRKVIYLLISTGFAELILIILAFIVGMPLPLLPVQLLWLNLVTNGLQEAFLAFETAERGILKRKPREPREKIFNPIMIKRILLGSFYMAISAFIIFYILLENGMDEYSARNITLLLMVLFENAHVFNSRTEVNYLHKMPYKNSILLIVWVAITHILHLSCMNIGFMQEMLSLEPVDVSMWFSLLVVALGLVFVMEIEKFIRKRSAS